MSKETLQQDSIGSASGAHSHCTVSKSGADQNREGCLDKTAKTSKVANEAQLTAGGAGGGTRRRIGVSLALVVAGCALGPPMVVGGVGLLGFGSAGVVAGSIAASVQTASTAAGSAFAVAQSIGATGAVGLGAKVFGGSVGCATAAAVNRFWPKRKETASTDKVAK